MIRQMNSQILPDVLRIYEQGIQTGIATFEAKIPSIEEWDNAHHATLRYVAEDNGQITGWITLSAVSTRHAYRGVGEVSIYIDEKFRGQGVAQTLMQHLIKQSEEHGFWTLQSSVFSINAASLALHQKLGFRIIGTREKIAQLHGTWQDTVLLERRSPSIY